MIDKQEIMKSNDLLIHQIMSNDDRACRPLSGEPKMSNEA